MSNQPDHSREPAGDKPLFQGMDEREQIYAPEQVPGGVTGGQAEPVDVQAPVPIAPSTVTTEPILTEAGPASVAASKQRPDADNERVDE